MPVEFDKARGRFKVVIDRVLDGERFRQQKLMPPNCTREEALAIAAKMDTELVVRRTLARQIDDWPEYIDSLMANRGSWIHKSVAQARSRTKRKGGGPCIDANDIRRLLIRCGGRCEVTGLRLRMEQTRNRDPLAPSIDRMDNARAYDPGNCRIVCYAVNVAMLHWGEDTFGQIATGWVVNKYTTYGLVQALKV